MRRIHREHFGCSKSHYINPESKSLDARYNCLIHRIFKTHLFLYPFAGITSLTGWNTRHRNENDSNFDIQTVCYLPSERMQNVRKSTEDKIDPEHKQTQPGRRSSWQALGTFMLPNRSQLAEPGSFSAALCWTVRCCELFMKLVFPSLILVPV